MVHVCTKVEGGCVVVYAFCNIPISNDYNYNDS